MTTTPEGRTPDQPRTPDLATPEPRGREDREVRGPTTRGPTAGDVAVGILLLIGGAVLLGNAAIATVASVRLLGWTALVGGVVLVAVTLRRIRTDGSWTAVLGGVGLAVLGLFLLRNTAVGALTLTLLAGSMFLTAGLVRVVIGALVPQARAVLVISGLISAGLGLWILLDLTTATLTLLGILLGVQVLLEGGTLLALGRDRPATREAGIPVRGTPATGASPADVPDRRRTARHHAN